MTHTRRQQDQLFLLKPKTSAEPSGLLPILMSLHLIPLDFKLGIHIRRTARDARLERQPCGLRLLAQVSSPRRKRILTDFSTSQQRGCLPSGLFRRRNVRDRAWVAFGQVCSAVAAVASIRIVTELITPEESGSSHCWAGWQRWRQVSPRSHAPGAHPA
jgi:hypothetical protein